MTKKEFMHAYASPYYDPVKAHEYYMRTRQLKGRRSTAGMSEEQRNAWSHVRNEVRTEKKQKTEAINTAQKSDIEGLRNEASAARERLAEKIRDRLEKLLEETKGERGQIERERQSKLKTLAPIPKTASESQKAHLRKANSYTRAKIEDEARKKKGAVTEDVSKERSNISESGQSQRQEISENLKTVISSTREKVKGIKEALDKSTEETLDREYDNIMKNIAGKTKKSKKGKQSTGGTYAQANKQFIDANLAKRK